MKIIIKNLQIPVLIGHYAFEREAKQNLLFNLIIEFAQDEHDDLLSNTIDYAEICQLIREVADNSDFKLLETLLYNIKNRLFSNFTNINFLKINIAKKAIIDAEMIEIEESFLK